MNTNENTSSNIINPRVDKILGLAGFVLFLWMLSCFATVILDDIDNRAKNDAMHINEFKENCISGKGKVRHEETYLSVNVYCSEKNGDESVFVSEYTSTSITIKFVNKVTFGWFDLTK